MKETPFVVSVRFLEFSNIKKIRLCISRNKLNKSGTQKVLLCVIFIFFKFIFSILLWNQFGQQSHNKFPEQPSTHDGKLFTVSPSCKCSGSWEWSFHLAVIETDKPQKTMSTQPWEPRTDSALTEKRESLLRFPAFM